MSVLIEGVFARHRLLSLLLDFTVFGDTSSGIAKIIAGYHQFHAVKRAVISTVEAIRSHPPDLEGAAVRGVLAQAEAMLSEIASQ